jgi:ankyrin repeat protein
VSKRDIAVLLAKFRQADFFSLKDRYAAGGTDGETVAISISVDGRTKRVIDESGLQAGLPEMVESLEQAVDETAGTDKWIRHTSETWPALLAEHWNFRAQTEENRLLFESVVAHEETELVQKFLAAGAPVLAMDKNGMGPLVSAAENGDLRLVEQMTAGKDHLPSALLVSALHAAARSGSTEVLEFLLEHGADVNADATDEQDDETVLVDAVRSGKAEMVKVVLEQHPNVDAKGRDGQTALMISLQPRQPSAQTDAIVKLLMSAGANVNARANDGETPVFFTCYSPEVIKLLMQAGADLNAQNIGGLTPLMKCPPLGYLQALVDAGADLSVRNQYGETAEERFRSQGLLEQANLLEAAMRARQR